MSRVEQTAFWFLFGTGAEPRGAAAQASGGEPQRPDRGPERPAADAVVMGTGGPAARVGERRASRSAPRLARTLALPFGRGSHGPADHLEQRRQHLERRIAAELPLGRLALAVTDNRHTIISVKREKGLYRLRLHHMFLDAESEVIRALGRYVGENDRDASNFLGRYIDLNQHLIRRVRRARPAPITLETAGEVFDLQRVFDDLNERYFERRIDARITWGQRPPPGARRRKRNSIKMGSYSVEDRLIRIHPSLDRPFVPRYFLEWIVYHEMLHQKHDIPVVGGRRQFHTPEFLLEEAAFENYDRARRWERENLNRLLVF